jgi:galactose mutarotase-like enzyme
MYTDAIHPGVGGFPTVVLASPDGLSEVHIVPERGALVTRFRVGDDEVLYLDEATLADPTKNVRGGIPVLFPFAGKLPNDSYEAHGRTWTLTQHGFARRLPWRLVERGSDSTHAWLECLLESNEETLAVFPWKFALALRFKLSGAQLTLDTRIENRDTTPMPHALGFHPYFFVPDALKGQSGVRTDAKVALDNTTGQQVLVRKLDFTVKELDLHLQGHSTAGTLVRRSGKPRLALDWSPLFTTLVLWTVAGKDFICVEPWEAPGGTFAKHGHAPVLAPGQSLDLVFELTDGVR